MAVSLFEDMYPQRCQQSCPGCIAGHPLAVTEECMYVCMYVCMHVCIHMYVGLYIYMYMYMYMHMVCMYFCHSHSTDQARFTACQYLQAPRALA